MGKAILKVVIGLVVAAGLWFGAMAMEFPPVFQLAFITFAVIGTLVFLILDAPQMNSPSGWPAFVSVIGFYIVLCFGYGATASLWPQFEPGDEQEKIAKILEGKENPLDPWNADEVIKRIKELDEKGQMLTERIKALGGDQPLAAPVAVVASAPKAGGSEGSGDVMKIGEEQWQLQECYNCHKIRGEGGKKRGPELDNIGSLLTVEEIKEKIFDPKSFMAEGFEKEWEKGRMPDKFKDVMSDAEGTALATWLSTFKNTAVATPKPIKKK